jgi:DNA modification methylase
MVTSSQLHIGDSLEVLPLLKDDSITAVFTSPPYNLTVPGLYSSQFTDAVPVNVFMAQHVSLFEEYDRVVKPNGSKFSAFFLSVFLSFQK